MESCICLPRRHPAACACPHSTQGQIYLADLCHPERHHRSTLHQTGYPYLPQPFNLSSARTTKEVAVTLSLQFKSRRRFVSEELGVRQRLPKGADGKKRRSPLKGSVSVRQALPGPSISLSRRLKNQRRCGAW